MLLELQLAAAEPSRRRLRGPTTLGGSQADGIAVPGLPPAALRLEPRPAGLLVSPAAAGLRVGPRPVAPGARRLLRPGERASFQRLSLGVPLPPCADRTRATAAALMREAARDPGGPEGPHLVVLTGPLAGRRAALAPGLVVGRGRTAGLRLADAAASRRHARFQLGPEGVTVEDLGSKNRLRVNGVPVERQPIPLRPGDLLLIGETELAYEGPTGPPASPPAAGPARASLTPRARRSFRAFPALPAGARPLVAAALLAISAAALAAIASCG
jgi:hypothetical protein